MLVGSVLCPMVTNTDQSLSVQQNQNTSPSNKHSSESVLSRFTYLNIILQIQYIGTVVVILLFKEPTAACQVKSTVQL
jgi:hypothetical protein